ncbi:MAG: NAD-glutamate dehydrogenase, partial [Propionibacteriaceae bacterium]
MTRETEAHKADRTFDPRADHSYGVPGTADARVFEAYYGEANTDETAGRPREQLEALVRSHVAVAHQRRPHEILLRVLTPSDLSEGIGAGGSTLVQIVTDDRPFLVSTVTMLTGREGWTVRGVFHPRLLAVRRDGELVAIHESADAVEESWISLEVFPPLGTPAADLAHHLETTLRSGLEAVMQSAADFEPMRAVVGDVVEGLDSNPQPVSPQVVRGAIDLLRWMAKGHFLFLGYHEFRYARGRFTPVPGTGLGILHALPEDRFDADPTREGGLLVITKDSAKSTVNRDAYLDYVAARIYDNRGRMIGEHRFVGLWTQSAYAESVQRVPLLGEKAKELMARSGYDLQDHAGRTFWQAVESHPRDELFQADVEELYPTLVRVAALAEHRQVRLFVRQGGYGRFLTCLVYLPRDRYTTETRRRIQDVLMREFDGLSLTYQASVTESMLARLYFVLRRRDDEPVPAAELVRAVEAKIAEATRGWDDNFNEAAADLRSEERGVEFGEAYESAYTPTEAVADLRQMNALQGPDDLRYAAGLTEDDDPADIRLKVFVARPTSLADVLPHLSTLGVEVVDERPFVVDLRGKTVHVYEFGLRIPGGRGAATGWTDATKKRFFEAFRASYSGAAHAGQMNRLVLAAGLTWRQVSWLRAISRYLQQLGTTYSMQYIAAALNDNPPLARRLVQAFETRFDPSLGLDVEDRQLAFADQLGELESELAGVASLDHDRIFRTYIAVLRAMVRTNAFAADQPALAFKVFPRLLEMAPEPRPQFEVFVYSTRVQGLHLRFGRVARGGLRWSDRREDFRTEILGLVKAQMVKNTVIVPVGAKGGFVPQSLPDPSQDRSGWLAEGIACYRLFVSSLLSVTDNIVEGRTIGPKDVIRYDGDDPYLVVAADKGTATFSDIANEISVGRDFWLHDAFASGGSAGYDHKKMGITARGAWESVKRHFREMGVDCQTTDFTCAGIGDMAGDVFGNGMLLSRHIRLVAAFNHAHVFLDPNPDAATSFVERERLFNLPRSSWSDYDASLISAGGGIYPRSAKSVPITPEVRAALGLADDVIAMTPAQVINAILKAPVDLLWNGGIGTYVKAAAETNSEAGDRANDAVRVNGGEVRAACAGEGGNLGWTQAGRVEYALKGGRINTDFIDNSAGVDTSDHEVNIKILLQRELAAGRLTLADRDVLLASMTDEVAALVLSHNIDQNVALANSMFRAHELAEADESWMRKLESLGLLDRRLESLPSSAELRARQASGRGLTCPEKATILAYTKIALKDMVLATDLPEDPFLADRLVTYFPKPLRERYADVMPAHPLAREIITTVAVNRFVNSQGATAIHRLTLETGAAITDIIRAQLAARSIFAVGRSEVALSRLNALDAALVTELRMELRRLVERATRWLAVTKRPPLDIRATIDRYADGVGRVRASMPAMLTSREQAHVASDVAAWTAAGASEELALEFAEANYAHTALGVVAVAQRLGVDEVEAARVHGGLAERIGLDVMTSQVVALPQEERW